MAEQDTGARNEGSGEFRVDSTPPLEPGHTPAGFHTWIAADESVKVDISLGMMKRLCSQLEHGPAARPGPDSGGLLLGRLEPGNIKRVIVEDFERLPYESAGVPFHVVSARHAPLVRKAVEYWAPNSSNRLSAVGYYRTHKGHEFTLTRDDEDFIRARFGTGVHVCLLVNTTRLGHLAAMFLSDDGRPSSAEPQHVFTIRAQSRTAIKDAPVLAEPGPVHPPFQGPAHLHDSQRARQAMPPEEPSFDLLDDSSGSEGARRTGRTVVWIAVVAMLLAAAGAGIYKYGKGVPVQTARPAQAAPVREEAATALGLKVARDGPALRISWKPVSPVMTGAQRGVLSIVDGDYRRELQLGSDQLQSGSLLYMPLSGDVQLRLDVFSSAGAPVGESVRVLDPRLGEKIPTVDSSIPMEPTLREALNILANSPSTMASRPLPTNPADLTGQRAQPSNQAATPPEPVTERRTKPRIAAASESDEVSSEKPEGSKDRASGSVEHVASDAAKPPPLTDFPAKATVPALVRPDVPTSPGDQKSTEAQRVEPRNVTGQGSAQSLIAPISNGVAVGPRLLHNAPLAIPSWVKTDLKHDVSVTVQVSVDASGKVLRADSPKQGDKIADMLTSIAVAAVRSYKFAPASVGGKSVPGEITLHFNFSRNH